MSTGRRATAAKGRVSSAKKAVAVPASSAKGRASSAKKTVAASSAKGSRAVSEKARSAGAKARAASKKARSAGAKARARAKARDGIATLGAKEIDALRRDLEARATGLAGTADDASLRRWNPDPDDVRRSVAQLVLALVEFLRKLLERQAIRRMEKETLSSAEVERLGLALMRLEETVHDLARQFDLDPEDLNLDLGPLGRLS